MSVRTTSDPGRGSSGSSRTSTPKGAGRSRAASRAPCPAPAQAARWSTPPAKTPGLRRGGPSPTLPARMLPRDCRLPGLPGMVGRWRASCLERSHSRSPGGPRQSRLSLPPALPTLPTPPGAMPALGGDRSGLDYLSLPACQSSGDTRAVGVPACTRVPMWTDDSRTPRAAPGDRLPRLHPLHSPATGPANRSCALPTKRSSGIASGVCP